MLGIRVASDTQYLRAVCPAHLVRRAVNLKVDTRAQANMHTHFLLLQPKVEKRARAYLHVFPSEQCSKE